MMRDMVRRNQLAPALIAFAIAGASAGCGWSEKKATDTVTAKTSLDQSPLGVSWTRPDSQVADLTYAPRHVLFPATSQGPPIPFRLAEENEAWAKYCRGLSLTDAEATAVESTPMPESLLGQCGALK